MNSVATKIALAAVAACVASPAAMAAVVCNNTLIPIPATADGVYINWTTGATSTTGVANPGFDINLYGIAALNVYWGADVDANNAGVASSTATTGTFSNLAAGTPVSASSIFNGGSGTTYMAVWKAGVTNGLMGIRFTNDTTSAVNYGWVRMTTTATSGFPASISQWCFENTGAQIIAGTTPVSLQKFSVD